MPDNHPRLPDWKPLADPSMLGLPPDSTILITSPGSPARHGIGLRTLCQNGRSDDTALVVTTLTGSDEILHAYDGLCNEASRPSLRLVDTTADYPSGRRSYKERPVVFVPGAGDIERIVVALSDLTDARSKAGSTRHLVVDSLTPVLQTAPTGSVCRMIERVAGIRAGGGYCLFGLDYTAHSAETMAAVTDHVDGILWVTQSDETIALEYRPARGRHLTAPREAAVDD